MFWSERIERYGRTRSKEQQLLARLQVTSRTSDPQKAPSPQTEQHACELLIAIPSGIVIPPTLSAMASFARGSRGIPFAAVSGKAISGRSQGFPLTSIPQIFIIVFMKFAASACTQISTITISTNMVQKPPYYPIIAVHLTPRIKRSCITSSPGANLLYRCSQCILCELRIRPRLLGTLILRFESLAVAPQMFIVHNNSFSLLQGQ